MTTASDPVSSSIPRRACLSAIAAGVSSLVLPRSIRAQDDINAEAEPAPEPIDPALVRELVGRYEVRLEWLFRGRICVENPKLQREDGLLQGDGQLEWVDHWKARDVSLESDIRIVNGRLELHTNFVWSPPGTIFLGPGAIFSARIDGRRERAVEGEGAMRFLRSVEQDQSNIVTKESVCHVQEWWYRHSSDAPWEPLQTRQTTLCFESPGMLVLDLYSIQAASPFPREMRESLRFRKIPQIDKAKPR